MNNSHKEIKYDGDVLTDITSFSMVQNIFDGGQKKINRSQIQSLDSIIQLLVFYDNVWIIEPFPYGGDIEINSQEILNTLIQKEKVKQFPQLDSNDQDDFKTQFEEIQEIIKPHTFATYFDSHKHIAQDLKIYEKNFGLINNKKARELADSVQIDHKLIPLCANLLRTNFYSKLIRMKEEKDKKIITYSPNVLRTSLVEDIKKYQDIKISNNINQILEENLDSITVSQKERMEYIAKKTYSDIELELPLLTAIVIDQCENKADFFNHIFDLQKDPDAVRIRRWLKEFQYDISNNKKINVDEKVKQLKKFSESLGSESSTKVKLINCIKNPGELVAAAAGSVATQSPIFIAAWAGAKLLELGIPLIEPFWNKDLSLLYKLRKKSNTISFNREKFEEIFDVKVHL